MPPDTYNFADVLHTPLTPEQIIARRDGDGFVSGLVLMETEEMINGDLESVLDTLSERLVNSSLGMEIDYQPAAVLDDGSIVMRVALNPAAVLGE
jgi:hypothetical protein